MTFECDSGFSGQGSPVLQFNKHLKGPHVTQLRGAALSCTTDRLNNREKETFILNKNILFSLRIATNMKPFSGDQHQTKSCTNIKHSLRIACERLNDLKEHVAALLDMNQITQIPAETHILKPLNQIKNDRCFVNMTVGEKIDVEKLWIAPLMSAH